MKFDGKKYSKKGTNNDLILKPLNNNKKLKLKTSKTDSEKLKKLKIESLKNAVISTNSSTANSVLVTPVTNINNLSQNGKKKKKNRRQRKNQRRVNNSNLSDKSTPQSNEAKKVKKNVDKKSPMKNGLLSETSNCITNKSNNKDKKVIKKLTNKSSKSIEQGLKKDKLIKLDKSSKVTIEDKSTAKKAKKIKVQPNAIPIVQNTNPVASISEENKVKKRKMVDSKDNPSLNGESSVTDATGEGPKKKRKKPKKSKKKKKVEDPDTVKTQIFVKTRDDFSANWKQLQKVLDVEKEENQVTQKEKTQKESTEQKENEKSSKKKKLNKKTEESNEEITKDKSVKPDIWFDDVDPILIEGYIDEQDEQEESDLDNKSKSKSHRNKKVNTLIEPIIDSQGNTLELVKKNCYEGKTKLIAMDCEMVGVGPEGEDSVLARISIVNHFGKVLYDKYVKPREKVTDYRTKVSGIRPHDLEKAEEFLVVQKEVSELLSERVLVGHALHNDLQCLFLSHPRKLLRDTSLYKPFKKMFGGRKPSLRKLTERLLNMKIQHGEHSSVQDAQAAMRIYTLNRKEWEAQILKKRPRKATEEVKETVGDAELEKSKTGDDVPSANKTKDKST